MYVYKDFIDLGVLVIKFSGSFVDDEARQSVLHIARSMSQHEIQAIRTVILDLKDITSTTMANTDTAGVSHWKRELFSVSNLPIKDIAAHIASMKVFEILPENSVAKDGFIKRTAHLKRTDKINSAGNSQFSDILDLLEHLDLLTIIPLLAEGWKEGPAQ